MGIKRKLGDKVDPIRIKLGSTIDINPDYSKPSLNQEKLIAARKHQNVKSQLMTSSQREKDQNLIQVRDELRRNTVKGVSSGGGD